MGPKSKSVPSLEAPSSQKLALAAPNVQSHLKRSASAGLSDPISGSRHRRRLSGFAGGGTRLLVHGGMLGSGKPTITQGAGLDPRSIYTRSLIPPLPPAE